MSRLDTSIERKPKVFLNSTPKNSKIKPPVPFPKIIYSNHIIFDGIFIPLKIEKAVPMISNSERFKPLILTEKGAIMALEGKDLYISFDLMKSNWPRSPSFVIFWHNYFDIIAKSRDNFTFTKIEQPFVFPNVLKLGNKYQAVNFLSEYESNNKGKKDINRLEKSFYEENTVRSLRRELILLIIFLLIVFWISDS